MSSRRNQSLCSGRRRSPVTIPATPYDINQLSVTLALQARRTLPSSSTDSHASGIAWQGRDMDTEKARGGENVTANTKTA